MRVEVSVLGGLKIAVDAKWYKYEDFEGHVESDFEFEIIEVSGRPVKKQSSVKWLYDRIADKDESHLIEEAAHDEVGRQQYEDASYRGDNLNTWSLL